MSKKSKGLTIPINGTETSFHKLVIDVNKKWKENIGLFALERFLKKEAKKKTSELNAIFTHFGVNADQLNVEIIKIIFADNRLVTTKGKDKTTFSAFSWLKDLQKYCESNDLKKLFETDREVIHLEVEKRVEQLKKAA